MKISDFNPYKGEPTQALHVRIPESLMKRMNALIDEVGMDKTKFVIKAFEMFIPYLERRITGKDE